MKGQIIVIGAGVAGLSAAITLAKNGQRVLLVSQMPSFRVQSVMAEGGINGALNTMGEDDCTKYHAEDTIRAGRFLANPKAVQDMTNAAPELIQELYQNGCSFQLTEDKQLALRSFGGQSRKRTAYASSSTGKQIMHTLVTTLRKYEAEGLVERWDHWYFLKAEIVEDSIRGCYLFHGDTKEIQFLSGAQIIVASGGLNGLFGNATGSVLNSGDVTASLFASGVKLANAEMIQYHPTTVRLLRKNMLITEAVRGEGGRLYVVKNKKPYYFMEEKYPELGNLMPRDIVAKEEYLLMQQGYQIFLDMTRLTKEAYAKLGSVVTGCKEFLKVDVTKEPILVEPGIHYFMGGLLVDRRHRTNIKGLYAAGECACAYHGANRLGGNSLLGALYGGRVAAQTAVEEMKSIERNDQLEIDTKQFRVQSDEKVDLREYKLRLQKILKNALGIYREEKVLQEAIEEVSILLAATDGKQFCTDRYLDESYHFPNECKLGLALLESALQRKESRGAHNRIEYPEEKEQYQKITVASWKAGKAEIEFQSVEESNAD